MRTILVTGGAGFIGSNLIRYLLRHTETEYAVVNLDALTYAGSRENLRDVESNPRYAFVKGSVCDTPLLDGLFAEYEIGSVVHFAAESYVDRSITRPGLFVQTNVLGTQALLDAARRHWRLYPEDAHCRSTGPVWNSCKCPPTRSTARCETQGGLRRSLRLPRTAPMRPRRRERTCWCGPIAKPTGCR